MKLYLSLAVIISVVCVVICAPPALKITDNKILDSTGKVVKLRGVNRSGAEFSCIQGNGIWDGPTDQNSVSNILKWNVNIVRVPLNEDCWLGINGVSPSMGGEAYQKAISAYVTLLNNNNIYVILDLHWTAAGSTKATQQTPMPDKDHAPDFWRSVATYFKGNNAVIFDIFNEPYPNGNTFDQTAAWNCWKSGTQCTGTNYEVAGMQDLVNAVRSVGSNHILMLGGLAYSNSLTQWLTYAPNDTLNQLAASWHSYNFNFCKDKSCWDQYVLPVSKKVPVIIGEMGEDDCAHGYVDGLMNWADTNGVGYLGWTWNTWDCKTGPSLISNYDGTATNFGQGIKNHYASL